MEGNKDEALRCVGIAEEAIALGDKHRALKFLKIAHRLNRDLPLQSLFDTCHRIHSRSPSAAAPPAAPSPPREARNYTDENVSLIREIKSKSDYYAILGLEKSSSVEEIRKAYRKLSLKVHPDKNKAPGSEDAFKKVSKAFKCLSDDASRRIYDQTGTADEFENAEVNTFRRRRRRTTTSAHDFFGDDFDPDEIFRAFFGHSDVFGRNHVYRTRGGVGSHHNHRPEFNAGSGGRHHNVMLLIQLLPFLLIVLLAYLPFSEPEYSLHKHYAYHAPKTTAENGVQFFVKSSAAFEGSYPPGSDARRAVEESVEKDYRLMLRRYCQVEMQRRTWNRNLPAPHCDKLKSFTVAA